MTEPKPVPERFFAPPCHGLYGYCDAADTSIAAAMAHFQCSSQAMLPSNSAQARALHWRTRMRQMLKCMSRAGIRLRRRRRRCDSAVRCVVNSATRVQDPGRLPHPVRAGHMVDQQIRNHQRRPALGAAAIAARWHITPLPTTGHRVSESRSILGATARPRSMRISAATRKHSARYGDPVALEQNWTIADITLASGDRRCRPRSCEPGRHD